MTIALAIALTVGILVFVLFIRGKDVPEPVPVSPWQHLEDRKAAIYDNLRDLQFEYRVGKLSDADYEATDSTLRAEAIEILRALDRARQAD